MSMPYLETKAHVINVTLQQRLWGERAKSVTLAQYQWYCRMARWFFAVSCSHHCIGWMEQQTFYSLLLA